MRQPDYFLMSLKADQTIDLKSRWKTQPEWIRLQETVRSTLADGGRLPADLPMIEAEFGGGIIKLVDLRGIDLSNLAIGKIVLAYCCFDFADFSGTRFENTYLQYSSMEEARFNSSNWNKVQASPISAIRASFVGAHIHKSFLMRSNLDGAIFRNATITATALAGSVLGSARLSDAEHLNRVDITEVSLDSGQEVEQLATNGGVFGLPKEGVYHVQKMVRGVTRGVVMRTGRTMRPGVVMHTLLGSLIEDDQLRALKFGVQFAVAGGISRSNVERFSSVRSGVTVKIGDVVELSEAKFSTKRAGLSKRRAKAISWVVNRVIEK